MMDDMDHLLKIREQLKAAGRWKEILDENGKIRPSESACKKYFTSGLLSDEEAGNQYRLAQAQTILDLANKYQSELN